MRATVLFVLLVVSPLAAEEQTPLWLHGHERAPDAISTAAVGAAIGLDVFHVIRHENDVEGWWRLGCRNGMALLFPELAKLIVQRWRPDRSDEQSFFSMHESLAAASARSAAGISLAVTVGWGRQAAGKHYATDVGVGALNGFLAQKVCR